MRTAIILTAYNRPQCIADAIASVREQSDATWRLYIMDDGCDAQTRNAISIALGRHPTTILSQGAPWRDADGRPVGETAALEQVVWWQGAERIPERRRATIPYSRSINFALNFLARTEDFITYLCDDDWLMPASIRVRADALSEHPEFGAVYGRLRSIHFGADGRRNNWEGDAGRVEPGRRWLPPTGRREAYPAGNAKTWYEGDATDPDTGLGYVEEGYWAPGPMRYGAPHQIDHNQLMHRRALLSQMTVAPVKVTDDGQMASYSEYWPEARYFEVGDAGFFRRLPCLFIGVDCWAVTKRYHMHSEGRSDALVRE